MHPCLQAQDLREEREGLMRDVAKLRTALQEVSAAGRGAALYCMMPQPVVGQGLREAQLSQALQLAAPGCGKLGTWLLRGDVVPIRAAWPFVMVGKGLLQSQMGPS